VCAFRVCSRMLFLSCHFSITAKTQTRGLKLRPLPRLRIAPGGDGLPVRKFLSYLLAAHNNASSLQLTLQQSGHMTATLAWALALALGPTVASAQCYEDTRCFYTCGYGYYQHAAGLRKRPRPISTVWRRHGP
jgi:hypothetical protein